jgi:hypothetical protein
VTRDWWTEPVFSRFTALWMSFLAATIGVLLS